VAAVPRREARQWACPLRACGWSPRGLPSGPPASLPLPHPAGTGTAGEAGAAIEARREWYLDHVARSRARRWSLCPRRWKPTPRWIGPERGTPLSRSRRPPLALRMVHWRARLAWRPDPSLALRRVCWQARLAWRPDPFGQSVPQGRRHPPSCPLPGMQARAAGTLRQGTTTSQAPRLSPLAASWGSCPAEPAPQRPVLTQPV